jgi:hypothetical protein
MLEDLAGRATLLLIGGILAGTAVGMAAARWWRGPGSAARGTALGLAVFALAMSVVSADFLALSRAQSRWLSVPGVLLGFDAVKLRESRGGRKLVGRGPAVEFDAPDGTRHSLRGLAGSQSQRTPGDTVPVRVDPAHPERAVIDDFQHRHAALWLFGTFAGLAWLVALHAAMLSREGGASPDTWRAEAEAARAAAAGGRRRKNRAKPAAQLTPAIQTTQAARANTATMPSSPGASDGPAAPGGRPAHETMHRAGLIGFAAAIGGIFVTAEFLPLGQAMAVGLGGIAGAMACLGLSALLKPGARWPGVVFGAAAAVAAPRSGAAGLWQLTS